MRAKLLGLLTLLILQAGCFFSPQISEAGYSLCEANKDCAPGRHCEQGYCMPPSWWNSDYAARYQVLVSNIGDKPVPAGALAELIIGDDGALSLEQAGFGPMLVYADPQKKKAERAVTLRDPRGSQYAFVFALPQAIKKGDTLGNYWLYTGGSSNVPATYSQASDVFAYYQSFDGDSLPEDAFRYDGTIDLSGGQAVLRPGAWLVSQDSFAQVSLDFKVQLAGAECHDFGLALSAGHLPQSLTPPYAAFVADNEGKVQQEVYGHNLPWQQVGEPTYADGRLHQYRISVVDDHLAFWVDGQANSELDLGEDWSMETLFIHVYSRDCSLKLMELRAAPAARIAPQVKVSDRVMWFKS